MKYLNGGNVIRLPLDQITVGDRLRTVREVQVENLIAMAEDTGITTPIHVRKTRDGYALIDGAHRLEAARRMGLAEIAAIAVDCRADEARAMEASNNLGAARMTPLQTAVFVASWKRTYYELHPERRQGVFKGNQHTGNVVTAQNAVTKSIADAFGRKERQIFKIMSVGERLTPEEIAALDALEAPLSLEDLDALGRISDPEERSWVVRKITLGAAKKVAEARRQIAAERGDEKAADNASDTGKDPAFNALLNAWKRAPMSARKRFLLEMRQEVWEAQNKGVPLAHWAEADDTGEAA